MQFLWISMALCAVMLTCAEARYTPNWQHKRARRMYKNGLKGGYRKGYNKPVNDKILQLQQFDQLNYSGDGGSGDGSSDGIGVDEDYEKTGVDGLGAGVEPFDPTDIGKGIEPEVYVPQATTVRPQPRTPEPFYPWAGVTSRPRPWTQKPFKPKPTTQKPENFWGFWNNVKSAVGDLGNSISDAASDVGDTVGDWGEGVGETFDNWGDAVVDWGEGVGETVNEWGEGVGETVNEWGDDISNTLDIWGDSISGMAIDLHGNIEETLDDAQRRASKAQFALIEAAKAAGEKLKQTYLEAKEGLPGLREQVLDSLQHFGILVSNGAEYVCNKITQITDQVHSLAIIQKIQEKLEQGDEKVSEFLQLIGHKMETWFQSHTQLTHQADVFQDAEIQGELQELVNYGILTEYDVTVLTETSQISEKLKLLMERGDPSVTTLIQLLEQKIARWSEDSEGGIYQVQQQLPAFFQDYEIQEELKELVEEGILTSRDIKMLTQSTSVISKLEQALERGDDRVTQIMILMADREEELQQQQSQRVAEIIPNIFQDDEVRQDLQELVDAGVFTEDDFDILTQQTSQKGVINIEKRTFNQRGWFDSIGDAFEDLGNAIVDTAGDVGDQVGETVGEWGNQASQFDGNAVDQIQDTAGNVGETVGEWGNQAAQFAVDAADQVVDAAADAKDAVFDKRYVYPSRMDGLRGKRGWFDSIGDTFDGWGDTLSQWGGHVANFADNAADKVADVAVGAKDAIANAFDKRELMEADIRK